MTQQSVSAPNLLQALATTAEEFRYLEFYEDIEVGQRPLEGDLWPVTGKHTDLRSRVMLVCMPSKALATITAAALVEVISYLRAIDNAPVVTIASDEDESADQPEAEPWVLLGCEMPATWTGNLWIRGCEVIRDSQGNPANGIKETSDEKAEFFSVYAQDAEGLHLCVADRDTRAECEILGEQLKAAFAARDAQ